MGSFHDTPNKCFVELRTGNRTELIQQSIERFGVPGKNTKDTYAIGGPCLSEATVPNY